MGKRPLTDDEKRQVLLLRERGANVAKIARTLDRSRTTIARFLDPEYRDRENERLRAYRDAHKGVCVDCGAETKYKAQRGEPTASTRCPSCSAKASKVWDSAAIVEAIKLWSSIHGKPPTSADWNSGMRDPRFPTATTVMNMFGGWANAIEAAGYKRPTVGKYVRSKNRRRLTPEDRDAAKALHAEGASWYEISQHLNISVSSARRLVNGQYAPKQDHPNRIWTREKVLDAIRMWNAEHGRPPTSTEWVTRSKDGRFPAANSVVGVSGAFDSWADAIEAAGFERLSGKRGAHVRPVARGTNRERQLQSLISMARKLSNAGMDPEKISSILNVDKDMVVGWLE